MKSSKYNFFIEKSGKIYCFNGISKLFFSISESQKKLLTNILDNPDNCEKKLPLFYKKMVRGNFILPDEIDEIDIIKRSNKEACDSKCYNLTILPTMDCNFKCWYCYEKHNNYVMSDETVERIKKYILNTLNKENVESFYLDWFGGEPFLAYERVIKPISLFAKKVCESKNIPFCSAATSNGFLIDENIAKELHLLKFNHIQVTLDGEKSLHDKTREAPNTSSFETILKNMNCICKYNDNILVTLRINYDDKNFDPELILSQVQDIIEEKFQHHFSFLIRKVWQVGKVDDGREKMQRFIDLVQKTNFKFIHENDFNTDFVPCYAARKNMKLITPYGSIGKCTTKDDFEINALGYLTEDGTIKWRNNLNFDEIYATPLFDNEKCRNCKQLPLCMGICPRDINIDGKIPEVDLCKGRVNDLSLNDVICNYCEMYDK